MRRLIPVIVALLIGAALCWSGVAAEDRAGRNAALYRSPYGVKLPWAVKDLIPDLVEGDRGDPLLEARIPENAWYDRSHVGPWGPLPRQYPPPSIADLKTDDWKRARIIAMALRFVGYGYRHHHIPDWDPPQGWHMPKTGSFRYDGKGVDCSNFTSFVYNQGLGIGINSDIRKQAATVSVALHGADRTLPVAVIPRQKSPALWAAVLKPGDLLFIRSRKGDNISHVVMWIGEWGFPPDQPLVLDSHGSGVRDSAGNRIPGGVYLRPFRFSSWYAANADHAIRIIGPESAVEGQP